MTAVATSWTCKNRNITFDTPLLVGIMNMTPDSFSDGGVLSTVEEACARASQLITDGALMLDIGGESTRPGAESVSAQEQINRVVPAIQAINDRFDIAISIDTTQSEVAMAAVDAGATIVNDVSAGIDDKDMFQFVAETGVGVVLMHRRLLPCEDKYSDQYKEDPKSHDIVGDIIAWLSGRIDVAMRIGVQSNCIAIDPGLGFGKSVEQNWQIVEQIDRFHELGHPIYIGASRKSFLGATAQIDEPTHRDEVSCVAAFEMATKGAQIFRVHDVSGHAQMLQSLSSFNNL